MSIGLSKSVLSSGLSSAGFCPKRCPIGQSKMHFCDAKAFSCNSLSHSPMVGRNVCPLSTVDNWTAISPYGSGSPLVQPNDELNDPQRYIQSRFQVGQFEFTQPLEAWNGLSFRHQNSPLTSPEKSVLGRKFLRRFSPLVRPGWQTRRPGTWEKVFEDCF